MKVLATFLVSIASASALSQPMTHDFTAAFECAPAAPAAMAATRAAVEEGLAAPPVPNQETGFRPASIASGAIDPSREFRSQVVGLEAIRAAQAQRKMAVTQGGQYDMPREVRREFQSYL